MACALKNGKVLQKNCEMIDSCCQRERLGMQRIRAGCVVWCAVWCGVRCAVVCGVRWCAVCGVRCGVRFGVRCGVGIGAFAMSIEYRNILAEVMKYYCLW